MMEDPVSEEISTILTIQMKHFKHSHVERTQVVAF